MIHWFKILLVLMLGVLSSCILFDWGASPQIHYGSFTDPRDGQVYKTVVIDSMTWFAQNLNYGTQVHSSDTGRIKNYNGVQKLCYKDSVQYCNVYGGLYTWLTAMALPDSCDSSSSTLCNPTGQVQGICPIGWHVPALAEYNKIFSLVSGDYCSTWLVPPNGQNNFGYSALLAGDYAHLISVVNVIGPYFVGNSNNTFFWTFLQNSISDTMYVIGMDNEDQSSITISSDSGRNFNFESLRCVRND